jgi:hypothetical protein
MRHFTLLTILFLLIGCGVAEKPLSGGTTPENVTDEFMRELFTADRDLLKDQQFKSRFFSQRLRRAIKDADEASDSIPKSKTEPWAWSGLPRYEDRFNSTLFDISEDAPTSFKIEGTIGDSRKASVQFAYFWSADTKRGADMRLNSIDLVNENGTWLIDDLISFHSDTVRRSLRTSLENIAENKP